VLASLTLVVPSVGPGGVDARAAEQTAAGGSSPDGAGSGEEGTDGEEGFFSSEHTPVAPGPAPEPPPLHELTPWDVEQNGVSDLLRLPELFDLAPDLTGVVPEGALFGGELPLDLVPDGEAVGALAEGAVATLAQVVEGLDPAGMLTELLDGDLVELPELPDLGPLGFEVPSEVLPTSYDIRLEGATGTLSYATGQVCVPTPVAWSGLAPQMTVSLCPTSAGGVSVSTEWIGPGVPPVGTMTIDYDVPQVPGVFPEATTLQVVVGTTGSAFPERFVTTAERDPSGDDPAGAETLLLTVRSTQPAALKELLLGHGPMPAPLARVAVRLAGIGALELTGFPGDAGTFQLHRGAAGEFALDLRQAIAAPAQRFVAEQFSGAVRVARLEVRGGGERLSYGGAVSSARQAGVQRQQLRLSAEASSAGLGVVLTEFDGAGRKAAQLDHVGLPVAVDVDLTVELDDASGIPRRVLLTHDAPTPNPSELLALGLFVGGVLDASFELSGAAQTRVEAQVTTDSTGSPNGLRLTTANTPDTGRMRLQAARWRGARVSVLSSQDGGANATYGLPSSPAFSLSSTRLPAPSDLRVVVNRDGAAFVATVDSVLPRAAAAGRVALSAVDARVGRVGMVFAQLPERMRFAGSGQFDASGNPVAASLEEDDSTLLSGALRQVYLGSESAPRSVLTVLGATASRAGGVPDGTEFNLLRQAPPRQYRFDLAAAYDAACGLPRQLETNTNNFDLGVPAGGDDLLRLSKPGVGALTFTNLPRGVATRKIDATLQNCEPAGVTVSGSSAAARPTESILFQYGPYQALFAGFAATFRTRVAVSLGNGSTDDRRLLVESVNDAPNPDQFVQFVKYHSGAPQYVVTLDQGRFPTGSVGPTGSEISVRATMLDPTRHTLQLASAQRQGVMSLQAGVHQASVRRQAVVDLVYEGVGRLGLRDLGAGTTVGLAVADGGASRRAQVSMTTVDDHPATVVQLAASVLGVEGSAVIAGPAAATVPGVSGPLQLRWTAAPRGGYVMDLEYGDRPSSASVTVQANNTEPASRITATFDQGVVDLCQGATCALVIGGGVEEGRTKFELKGSLDTGQMQVAGTYPSTPDTEFIQMVVRAGTTNRYALTIHGSAASLPWPTSAQTIALTYRHPSSRFVVDADIVGHGNQIATIDAALQRSEPCGSCALLAYVDGIAGLKKVHVSLTDIPREARMYARVGGADLLGELSYAASSDGANLTFVDDGVSIIARQVPTALTVKGSGNIQKQTLALQLDTAGSTCPSGVPKRCRLGFADVILPEIPLDIRIDDIKATMPFGNAGTPGGFTVVADAQALLEYDAGARLTLTDIGKLDVHMREASPEVPFPVIVWDQQPYLASNDFPDGIFFFSPQDFYRGPTLCPAPCTAGDRNFVKFGAVVHYGGEVGVTRRTWSKEITRPLPGQLAFYGWDACPHDSVDKYLWGDYDFVHGGGFCTTRITRTWAKTHSLWSAQARPFEVSFQHFTNWIGQLDNRAVHTRVFAVNPNYLLLTDYWDERFPEWQTDYIWQAPGSACPHFRFVVPSLDPTMISSNCLWQLMLGRLPPRPTGEG
jgi:hypothetical protein